ncbi:MAG: Rrf2 family transcriptional regulator [Acidimicrobiia bacterium]|nr:Rrf2 family transcriptional regulator [Acidimicrobiia bacterium]
MQLHLDQRTELAYQALLLLEGSGPDYVTGSDLADRLQITPDYLTKVVAPLSRAGWVVSTTGPSGGYRLSANLEELCILDLVEAVEGRVDRERCMHGDSRNPAPELCTLHEPWVRARDALLAELEETPIAVAGLSSPTKGE